MMSLMSKLRILPVTIFVAAFMLTLKVNDIWGGLDNMSQGVMLSTAEADQTPGAERPKTAREMLQTRQANANLPLELAQAEPAAEEAAPEAAPDEISDEDLFAEDGDDAGLGDDPTFYTQAEVDLLQKLAERREELEARGRELDVRENLLKAAEARIDEKVQSLRSLQGTIEDSLVQYDQQQEEKLVNLIKIYENMKPKDAGRIFEELEMDVLLEVAEKMNSRRLAPILAKMDPKKARDVTEELFRLRALPQAGDLAAGQ